jgi:plastocyanin
MTASTFNPTSRTVNANTAVTWDNDSGVDHNVTFINPGSALGVGGGGGGSFDAPASSSSTYQRQFAASGTHNFYCSIHGAPTSGMRGSIIVP